jgi:hypothetical protein
MLLGTLVFVVGNTLLWVASEHWQWPRLLIIMLASLLGVVTVAYDLGWRGLR